MLFAPKAHLQSSAKDGPKAPWIFWCPASSWFWSILGFSENFWIFPDRKQVRVHRFRRYHSVCRCPADSFEDFDSHWSRAKRIGRPKLKIASVTHFQNPILTIFFWKFGFREIGCCWHSLGTSARFQMVGGCVRKVFGVVPLQINSQLNARNAFGAPMPLRGCF